MTVSVVQYATGINGVAVLGSPPTNGNRLVVFAATTPSFGITLAGSGWTSLGTPAGMFTLYGWHRQAGASESSTFSASGPANLPAIIVIELTPCDFDAVVTKSAGNANDDPMVMPTLSPVAVGVSGYVLALFQTSFKDYFTGPDTIAVSPFVEIASVQDTGGNFDDLMAEGLAVASLASSYAPSANPNPAPGTADSANTWTGIAVSFTEGDVAPTADFTVSNTTPVLGDTITFTDLSTGEPTSWAWDFGDGGTSTSQNPTHVYAGLGTYEITLTATNAFGSDSETKTAYITVFSDTPFVPPIPGGVLLEIYAASPGAARWGIAKWGESVWSASAWQDVTPYGVNVDIDWGSDEPERGILSVPQAASWAVDFYDPDRILDPANRDGPYYGDLVPYLPIRVSHRGVVVRQGYATGISHNYIPGIGRNGYIRATDNISRLANAQVPSDTTLPNTLYARAVAAIAAAGLVVNVAAPIGTDPAVSPWVTGERSWSVWQWITDAAQEVLHIPIVDRLGTVTFRPWAVPLARGRTVDATELIDLGVVTDYSGMYSVVQARFDATTIIERALTPPPAFGARTYTRDEITIDAADWADAVLADRAFPILRWQPGDIYPLTANSVERFASVEAVERIGISDLYTDPAVIVDGIVVGGSINIRGKLNDLAIWRFNFNVAQTATEPLIETGGEPTDYLERTGGGEYLYPTGGA